MHPTQTSSKQSRTVLKRSDYPNVKYWDKQQNNKALFAVIKVADEDDSDEDDDSEDNKTTSSEKEKGIPAYLENEDGELIGYSEKKRLYGEVHGWWNDNIDSGKVPKNWSSAGAIL